MTEHERIRDLLALAAAGVLAPADDTAVRSHAASCHVCAAELLNLEAIAAELDALPPASAPPGLATRTAARAAEFLAARDQARWERFASLGLSVFGWLLGISFWAALKPVLPGLGLLPWLAATTILSWLTAGVAAVILGSRRAWRIS